MTENALQDPLRFQRDAPPCTLVIFGANGDLTKRKLLPALYRLAYDGRLTAGFAIVGISRTKMSDEEFRNRMKDSVSKFVENSPFDEDVWRPFSESLFYLAGRCQRRKDLSALGSQAERAGQSRETEGNVHVLSFHPTQPVRAKLRKASAARVSPKDEGWRRIVVEKPFGHDLPARKELSARLQTVFAESDIYRIDHYLGKETVQNILAFRFGNGIFEPLWNRRYIDHVQITAAESIGVEGPRRLLSGSGRASGHDPEPLVAGSVHGCHGAERHVLFGSRTR